MAVLERTKVYPQERLDKTDYENVEKFISADFEQMFKEIFTSSSLIVNGFEIFSDLACTNRTLTVSPVYIKITGSTVLHTTSTGPTFFVGSALTAASSVALTDGAVNYVELDLAQVTAVPSTRTFRDPNANEGVGADFTQIVNTVTNLIATVTVNTTGFSGGTKLPLYQITMAAGSITSALDKRNLFLRLAVSQPYNADYDYPWTSRGEPNPDLVADPNAILKGDKQIQNLKDWTNAVMTEIKKIKFGPLTGYSWTNNAATSLVQLGRELFLRGGGTLSWDGTTWNWTASFVIDITGTAFTNTITGASSIAVGATQVAYIDIIPTTTSVITISVVDTSSYVDQPNRYIIAKRDGTSLIIIDRLVG